ncbi:hypothetical protein [Spirosoma linguale]|uniref:UbiA prenyltransferase n=1 Tax=Spirosoma linguale (strain ATCC 33905 / DSM 74 / LMG 10896 / Claus 1) TaxID=504472 RepID=D2QCY6_SPILD|nr:hypothetical protein Slin_5015 [Spirosoma linguale DSM 74]
MITTTAYMLGMIRRIARAFVVILEFLLFSNVYIAICAVVMCQTTARLFGLHVPESLLLFTFLGTLGSYSLHWFLTDSSVDYSRRGRWNHRHKPLLFGLFVSAALAGLWLLSYLTTYLIDLLPVVFLTFMYSAPKINWQLFRMLRRIAVMKSLYLTFVWTYLTVAIPFIMAAPAQRPGWVLMGIWFLNRFLLIYSIALWFDYRDRAVDRQSRWLTLASMLTETQVRRFFYGIILLFGFTLLALYQQGLSGGYIICMGIPMLLLVLLTRRIQTSPSDYVYYLYIDGLLMLSGILLALISSQ